MGTTCFCVMPPMAKADWYQLNDFVAELKLKGSDAHCVDDLWKLYEESISCLFEAIMKHFQNRIQAVTLADLEKTTRLKGKQVISEVPKPQTLEQIRAHVKNFREEIPEGTYPSLETDEETYTGLGMIRNVAIPLILVNIDDNKNRMLAFLKDMEVSELILVSERELLLRFVGQDPQIKPRLNKVIPDPLTGGNKRKWRDPEHYVEGTKYALFSKELFREALAEILAGITTCFGKPAP